MQKIYVFLWFWLLVLLAVTALALLYSGFVLVAPSLRHMLLRTRTAQHQGALLALDQVIIIIITIIIIIIIIVAGDEVPAGGRLEGVLHPRPQHGASRVRGAGPGSQYIGFLNFDIGD